VYIFLDMSDYLVDIKTEVLPHRMPDVLCRYRVAMDRWSDYLKHKNGQDDLVNQRYVDELTGLKKEYRTRGKWMTVDRDYKIGDLVAVFVNGTDLQKGTILNGPFSSDFRCWKVKLDQADCVVAGWNNIDRQGNLSLNEYPDRTGVFYLSINDNNQTK